MEYKTRKWHDKCFQCVVCKSLVGSKPFIIPNETDVYCVSCFEEKFATKCTKCKKIMTTGGVTFKNEVSIFHNQTLWKLGTLGVTNFEFLTTRSFCLGVIVIILLVVDIPSTIPIILESFHFTSNLFGNILLQIIFASFQFQ